MADEQKKAAPDQEPPPRTQDKYKETLYNYIGLHKNFWRVHSEHAFKPQEAVVYFYLVEVCNSLSWKNPFNHSRRQITGNTGISPSVYKKSLTKLQDAGLIRFTPGRPGYRKDERTITSFELLTPNRVENVPVKTDNRVENVPVNRVENVPVKQSRKRTENEPLIKLNNKEKEERKKSAPPPHELIIDLFKKKYAARKNPAEYKIEADKFINNYEFKNWRISGVKMTAANVETKIDAWIMRYDSEFKRRDMPPTEPPKKMTTEDRLKEY